MNERVKLLRKSLQLSQEEFGARLGVTGTGVSRMESGNRKVTDQMSLAICREFNVNRTWLEFGDGEMFKSGDENLLNLIDRLLDGENDFAKSLFTELAKFSDEDWKRTEKFFSDVISGIKKEPQE